MLAGWRSNVLIVVGAISLAALGVCLGGLTGSVLKIAANVPEPAPAGSLIFTWCFYLALVAAFIVATAESGPERLLPPSSSSRLAAAEDELPRFSPSLEYPGSAEGGRSARVPPRPEIG